jgi:phosphoglucosamine mutase
MTLSTNTSASTLPPVRYFGTDGIRGRVGEFPITPDFVMKLGFAVGQVLQQYGLQQQTSQPSAQTTHTTQRHCVLIGKDTRISGYMFEAALEAGFSAAGVDVRLAGPMPTPAVAHLTRALRFSLGVVISASHNAFTDNGIKFFSGQGNKLPDAFEQAVEAKLSEVLAQGLTCVASPLLGKAKRLTDAEGRYIEFCKSTVAYDFNLRGMKIVVDAAHGAAYHIAPTVLHELGAQVIAIGVSPDGMNINHHVGAVHPQALCAKVIETQANLGIALDGDADRLIMCDHTGRVFNGDELLYVLMKDRLNHQQPSQPNQPNASGVQSAHSGCQGIVGTLMSNFGLEQAALRHGVDFVRAKVGDRYVLEALMQRGWQLGGESSGHVLCLDKHSTGDGLMSALQVLAALQNAKMTLAEITADLVMYPQKMINVRVADGINWQTHAQLQARIEEVSQQLQVNSAAPQGRILIRASGTEPVLRIMVEAKTQQIAEAAARYLSESFGIE